MNLRPNREQEPLDVNITPLIDVVFLLLIFFMVSTTFDKQAQLKVKLPEASPSSEQVQTESIVLAIDAKGQYYINDKQLVNTTIKTLKQALVKTMNDNKEIPVILKADAKTPHQAVVTAMDAAAQVGLTRLSIATMEGR
jgi:biopolymer transport protein ExbD